MFLSFEDYITNTTKAQRQAHINLNINCEFNCRKEKREFTSKRRSQQYARERIVKYLIQMGILHPLLAKQKFGKNGLVQCNHLCECGNGLSSNSNSVCHNPYHTYLGNASENFHDINPLNGISPNQIGFNSPNNKRCAGRKWMNNGVINKMIKHEDLNEYLTNGYVFGKL